MLGRDQQFTLMDEEDRWVGAFRLPYPLVSITGPCAITAPKASSPTDTTVAPPITSVPRAKPAATSKIPIHFLIVLVAISVSTPQLASAG